MTPKVSVVCAWYNRADYIADTLDSLLAQDFDEFEVIIVNDGSPDSRVKEVLDAYNDRRLMVVHQQNTGFTGAIRRAIELSSGEYIAIQGSGDISAPDRIKKQVELLSGCDEIAIVGSGCTQVAAKSKFRRRYFKPVGECSLESLRVNMPFVHGTAMYRKGFYVAAGGYDPRFKYCSDWDLFFRMLEQGRIVGLDLPLYEQRMFDDGFSFSPVHKFKQLWYKDRAINRSSESRELLEKADEIVSKISAEDISNMKYSVLYALKAFGKFDFTNSWQWFLLVTKQVMNVFTKANAAKPSS